VPLEGRIRAEQFRLEGFASAFKEILGTSGGQMQADVLLSGTLGAPRFAQNIQAQFQPIVIAPLGLNYDFATFNLDFHNGTDWVLTMGELYDESRETALEPVSRCGVTPPVRGEGEKRKDFSKHPYFALALKGSIPSLDITKMTLGGCVGLRDYAALAKKEMQGRFDGELTLGGTLDRPQVQGKVSVVEAMFAPRLTDKSVRSIETPLDVTLVRGAPGPPEVRAEKNPFKTGLKIDVEVVIPKDSTRLEPSFVQLYGEIRALLYPTGSLRIRTAGGEIGIIGTIEVPRERVYLFGRNFVVDRDSRAVFTGDMTADPQLFFTARHNIEHVDLSSIGLTTTRDSEVVVRITGSANEPRLRFSSTPAMDETNILSVIALGIPAGAGQEVGAAVQAQLFTAVMGMATLQFARDFQRRLALDVLRIEAQSADIGESRVIVGKHLAENLMLNYYLDLGSSEGEDQNQWALEYRLARYLSLLGRAGDSGDVGLELNLRFHD
jgi:autotransporter translocation and assembly factor TamB